MKIVTQKRNVQITIEQNDPTDFYTNYTVAIKCGRESHLFRATNERIHFDQPDKFIKAFSHFLKTREGEVELQATEESKLTFFRWNLKGDVGIKVQLTRYAYEADEPVDTKLQFTGAFALDSEYLLTLLQDFKQELFPNP